MICYNYDLVSLLHHYCTNNYPISTQSLVLTTLRKKPLENIVGKGENAGNQYFLLCPQYFLLFTKQISNLQSLLFCCLQILAIWTSLKYCRMVMSYIYMDSGCHVCNMLMLQYIFCCLFCHNVF